MRGSSFFKEEGMKKKAEGGGRKAEGIQLRITNYELRNRKIELNAIIVGTGRDLSGENKTMKMVVENGRKMAVETQCIMFS